MDYLLQEIPDERVTKYDLGSTHTYQQDINRRKRYSDSYFDNTLCEWNQLNRAVEESPSIAVFKKNLLHVMRPVRNPVYNSCDTPGVNVLTKLRVNSVP